MMTAEDQIKRAASIGQRIDALMERCYAIEAERRDSCDRVLHFLQDQIVFQQGQNDTQALNFNVPKGNDFEAAYLMALPEVRLLALDEATDGPSDLTYRPTTWIGTGTAVQTTASVDALIALSVAGAEGEEPKAYQNVAFPASQAFSSVMNINQLMTVSPQNQAAYSRNQYVSGLVFTPLWLLRAGSSMLMQVTPMYSGSRPSSGSGEVDDRVYEYRVRGVLAGYKKVKR